MLLDAPPAPVAESANVGICVASATERSTRVAVGQSTDTESGDADLGPWVVLPGGWLELRD